MKVDSKLHIGFGVSADNQADPCLLNGYKREKRQSGLPTQRFYSDDKIELFSILG